MAATNGKAGNPRIRIRDATPTDVDASVDVFYAAFGLDSMQELMHPGGVSESSRAVFGQRLFPKPKEGEKPKKSKDILMVAELLPSGDDVAEKTPEVVAFAKWHYHPEPRTEEEWNDIHLLTQEDVGEGADVDVYNDFIIALQRLRNKHSRSDPALFLGILATSPKRHRLGAGSALVKWGMDLADREALPAFVEASPMGYPLYRKYGYEDIDFMDYPITEKHGVVRPADRSWGQYSPIGGDLPEGQMRTAIMKRPAKKTASSA